MSNTNDPDHQSPYAKPTETAICLGCQSPFQSKNKKTHRVCPKCRKKKNSRQNNGKGYRV